MPILARLRNEIEKQHGAWFPWIAVGFAIGISCYFSIRFEPNLKVIVPLGFVTCLGFIAAVRFRDHCGVLPVFPLVCVMGFCWAGVNAHWNSAPRLSFHYYGPIYGRVVEIDRSGSHALRLTLDRVLLDGVQATPSRVRVSLHGSQGWYTPMPGQYIGLTGHLSAPNGPVEPRGFDFQRHAWFLQLGAVGYTRSPVLEMKPAGDGMHVDRLRREIATYVATYLGGDVGGFAAAVTTGDRSAFSKEALEALRVTNLAHLLAISGLHMGLLAAFLFGTFRFCFSLWQPWALRFPVKKVAAVMALVGASAYLLLSGASIATQRAYIMAAVALVAVCLARRALTLRSVSIAALIVLILRPYSLIAPGFQMSFSATAALVFVFAKLNDLPNLKLSRWQKTIFSLVASSFVAGIATAPFAAAHFNQWAAYGLLANVIAVPAMGMIVIPGAVLAAILAPLGLEALGLEFMGVGLRWILSVAHWVSAMEGARIPIVTPQVFVLPLVSIGGCWLILWQGFGRVLGALLVVVALIAWSQARRPDVLISGDGKLVGVMADAGRVLSKAKGQGFVARTWLENDGDGVSQQVAAARASSLERGVFDAPFAGTSLRHFQGKRGLGAFNGCHEGEILVFDQTFIDITECHVMDAAKLKQTGAVALWLDKGGFEIETVEQRRGRRLWSPPKVPAKNQ